MEIDVECDFADIVDALDPIKSIPQQPNQPTDQSTSIHIPTSTNSSSSTAIHRSGIKSMSKSKHCTRQQSHRKSTKSVKSELKVSNGSLRSSKSNQSDHSLPLSTKLMAKLRARRQRAFDKLRDEIIMRKSNGDIFGTKNPSEPTLRCPWCGDNKGYRYFTKHLHLKCQSKPAHLKQRAVSSRQTRSRMSKASLKQFMNSADDDDDETVVMDQEVETTEDDYGSTQKKKRNNGRVRRKYNPQPIVDEDYAPRRSRRKR